MPTRLNPYLSFKDNAREAMQFYHGVFGGKLVMNTFKEYHMSQDPKEDNKIMHAQLDTDSGMTLMAADTPESMEFRDSSNGSMSLSGENEQELKEYFNRLSQGGMVTLPLERAPWGDMFGMVTDKFGVNWMVNIAGKQS